MKAGTKGIVKIAGNYRANLSLVKITQFWLALT